MSRRICRALALSIGLASLGSAQTVLRVDANVPAGSAETGLNWRDAFVELQDALEQNLSAGDQIWVADGTYRPSVPSCIDCPAPGSRHSTFRIPSGVKVYGGFHGVVDPNDPNDDGEPNLAYRDEVANPTVLTGDINDDGIFYRDEDVYHVVTFLNVTSSTKLSGFTIEFGNANSEDPNETFEQIGGGILIAGTRVGQADLPSSPHITRCIIQQNVATVGGAGVAIDWTANPYDPNDPNESVPARIVSGFFEGNWLDKGGSGGAIAVHAAAFELTNDVFYSNEASVYGGGVYVFDEPNEPAVYAAGKITNCTFSSQKAEFGAAIYTSTARTILIDNCVCWEDSTGSTVESYTEISGGNLDVSFSDVLMPEGLVFASTRYPNSNFNLNPLFCDNRLVLDGGSPCIDAGLDLLVPPDAADLDDNGDADEALPWDRLALARFKESIPGGELVEMGAYESGDYRGNCPEDIDRDGWIDLTDLAMLLIKFGLSTGTCPTEAEDINHNGQVDSTDLAMLLAVYGGPCEGDSMIGDDDPLTQWLRTATPQEVLDWWNAGMPPIGGGEDQ